MLERLLCEQCMVVSVGLSIMAQSPKRDRFVTTTTVVVVSVLLLAFAGLSWYWRAAPSVGPGQGYAIVGPLTISTDKYSVAARIAVQTSKVNADWAAANQAALRKVVETKFAALDPQQVHAPGGLSSLQQQLKDAANQALHTDKIEQVLLTDFILQTDV